MSPWPQFNIKMTSYQYRKFHYGDKTILRPSYPHNGISYTGKIISLYWIRTLGTMSWLSFEQAVKLDELWHSLWCRHNTNAAGAGAFPSRRSHSANESLERRLNDQQRLQFRYNRPGLKCHVTHGLLSLRGIWLTPCLNWNGMDINIYIS